MLVWMILAVLVAGVFVIWPLIRKNNQVVEQDAFIDTNINLYQSQLEILEAKKESGEIDETQFAELQAELKQQLLQDTPEPSPVKSSNQTFVGKLVLLVCVFLLPIAAVGLYNYLGHAKDLKIAELLAERNQAQLTLAEDSAIRSELLKRLMQQLDKQPKNLAYLVSTARLLLEEQKFLLSANYYQQAVEVLPGQPEILAEFAQASYFASGNKITPVVEQALEQSLAIDPGNSTALGLKGIGHYGAGEYQQAIQAWQLALMRMPPSSEQASALNAGVEQAKINLQKMGLGQELEIAGEASQKRAVVSISLAENLSAQAEQVVYVFAKNPNAGPMPLAVARLRVADLPATVELNDNLAMPGGEKISSASEIKLTARVSSTGSVQKTSGDLEGETAIISLDQAAKGVELKIDSRL